MAGKGSGGRKGRSGQRARGGGKSGGGKKSGGGGSAGSAQKASGGGRIPAFVMFPVGLAVGWFVADWPGAIFGGVIGFFLWRSRA